MVEQGDSFNLEDRERLPWLEPADEVYGEDGVSPAKILGLVLLGLGLLALIVGGGYWLKTRSTRVAGGEPKLIGSGGGSYKTPLNEAGGKTFQGEGDTSYATSEGADTQGKIDASKVPEAPMADVSRGSITKEQDARPVASPAAGKITAKVKDETRAAKTASTPSSASKGGALIQLGAYGSKAVAVDAWKKFSKRFDYLEPLDNNVEPVKVGGQTLYRLRVRTISATDAANICGKLRVAGENCMVVN